jgi:hypothetical protein
MRVVREPNELIEAVGAAQREAASAFGNDTVFLERYVDNPRHVEIQIFADAHGTVVHLHERECSIQRRHQKIIEESPSPAMTADLRRAMGAAAVAAGRAINYVGAGTVEFLLAPSGEFFFLEVNTRLQVEHPVTEAVTGLDLVALQISVAEGDVLPDAATSPRLRGHAIEARLYAEDPINGYLPDTGTIRMFDVPIMNGIRVDSGIEAGSEISVHYDPMLAKVIAYGENRSEAIRKLSEALRRTHIHGVKTNRELLVGILDHAEFGAGNIDTHFLERHTPATLTEEVNNTKDVRLYALAAALADQASNRSKAAIWSAAPTGWRNNPSALHTRTYRFDSGSVHVAYALRHRSDGAGKGPSAIFEIDGAVLSDVSVGDITAQKVELIVGRVRRRFSVAADETSVIVSSSRGSLVLFPQSRFPEAEIETVPGSLVALMPGIVVRVDVHQGDSVSMGQTLLLLEAMKMEHSVTAPVNGTVVSMKVAVGETVDAGQVLVVIEESEEL